VTQSLATVGQMSCNPAIGGIGKAISCARSTPWAARGRLPPIRAGIQFRMLNAIEGRARFHY
jgi:tRNA uridine 5-carboxymethylaminomethyl modification enzyme